jgi:2-polyprenyl-3-methyl-5-hydroxy-6-metoxy-1,4-benzoquinol methylase
VEGEPAEAVASRPAGLLPPDIAAEGRPLIEDRTRGKQFQVGFGSFRTGEMILPPQSVPAEDRTAPIELFYDAIAEDFDRIMNHYDLRRRLETVFDTLLRNHDLTGHTLLDAGCGTGWFSLWACRRGAIVTSLDIGPRLLEQVRRKCDARTVQGDVLALRFGDGAFDVVISSECIEHTRNPRRAVHELVRVCRPGGLIAITCPNHFWYWLCAVANRFHLRPYEGLENWPRWREVKDWVEQAGAAILEMRGIHLLPFQISLLHPLLKFLDRFGRFHGKYCVNLAILAHKPC